MKVARLPSELHSGLRAVAIGTFDGVHLGHRRVLEAATEAGPRPAVVTFDPHPRAVLGYQVELLTTLARLVRPGTTIAVVSAREPTAFLPALRRLARGGFPTLFVGYGPDAERNAALARRAGISARVADLKGGWRSSRQLVLAG